MKKEKNILQLLISIFFIGAFIGYLYEVIFYKFTEGTFSNRGVLYGPWLPIYGIGALLITPLKKLKQNPILLFILMMLITGILEYTIGFAILKIFNIRLWSYKGLFLNINGLVCLRSMVSFAIGGIFLHYWIIPHLEKNPKYNRKTSTIIITIFILDIMFSLMYRHPITY